ncbi:uracil-DNA glycosylase [Candidatus Methanoliparum sp. LAM-1]|nr:uracil-DNA glycosylase [Candidatus Methanoliparum sp. LAM-1]
MLIVLNLNIIKINNNTMDFTAKKIAFSKLENTIKRCTKCNLCKNIRNYVVGEGSLDSKSIFVGEAPGEKEDETGRPFIGNAGKILTKMLNKANLKREDVYITNILKCRPPNNRDPLIEEINSCAPYLIEQLEILKPKMIVPLGRYSTFFILNLFKCENTGRMIEERGRLHKLRVWDSDVFIIPTYHPAAVIYRKDLEKVFQEDIMKVAQLLSSNHSANKKLDQFFNY